MPRLEQLGYVLVRRPVVLKLQLKPRRKRGNEQQPERWLLVERRQLG
jgi:hypothetical protein